MMGMAHVAALSGVILLGAMSPGPDFVIVTRSAAMSGRRAGMACAAGIGAGVFAWSAVTAAGVAGLLAASAVAFTAVKLAGAAYLMLLGIRALLAARRGEYQDLGPRRPDAARPPRRCWTPSCSAPWPRSSACCGSAWWPTSWGRCAGCSPGCGSGA